MSVYDREALVVLTDGIENRQRWISDVSDQIDETTYSIGFGTPQNISVAALQTISGNSGGYLLVTGAISTDNRFRLQKHFLQILAGVNNAEVVLDPEGRLRPGRTVRVPFSVADSDSGIEVILLTPRPRSVDFRIEGPLGEVITPWRALDEATMHFAFSDGAAFYRIAMPVLVEPGRFDHAGTWHAVLRIGKPQVERPRDPGACNPVRRREPPTAVAFPRLTAHRRFDLAQAAATNTAALAPARQVIDGKPTNSLPYSIVVHAYSSVSFRATADQSGHHSGSTVTVRGLVTQSGIPDHDAAVWAEVTTPDETTFKVEMNPDDEGHVGSFEASRPGVYNIRLRARGTTRSNVPFTREQLATATIWRGAGQPSDPASNPHPPTPTEGHDSLCDLVRCFIDRGALSNELVERLGEFGIDLGQLSKCICHQDREVPPR